MVPVHAGAQEVSSNKTKRVYRGGSLRLSWGGGRGGEGFQGDGFQGSTRQLKGLQRRQPLRCHHGRHVCRDVLEEHAVVLLLGLHAAPLRAHTSKQLMPRKQIIDKTECSNRD